MEAEKMWKSHCLELQTNKLKKVRIGSDEIYGRNETIYSGKL